MTITKTTHIVRDLNDDALAESATLNGAITAAECLVTPGLRSILTIVRVDTRRDSDGDEDEDETPLGEVTLSGFAAAPRSVESAVCDTLRNAFAFLYLNRVIARIHQGSMRRHDYSGTDMDAEDLLKAIADNIARGLSFDERTVAYKLDRMVNG